MKTLPFFTLLVLSLPLLLGIATVRAESTDESQAEVVVVITADNITASVIGRPDIDRLIIDGYDLSKFKSALIKRVERYHRSLLCIIMNAYDDIYTIARALNMTIERVNNNTYLITNNRKNIVLLALALNRTMVKIDKVNSTLTLEIMKVSQENQAQWKAISSIRNTMHKDRLELIQEIESLREELNRTKAEYERKLADQTNAFNRMLAQYTFAVLGILGVFIGAVIIKFH